MKGHLKITVLGCGNSTGVPAIGNHWGACDPAEPRNNRLRASIAVQSESTTLVIDTSPDFRQQLNRADIRTIDAVLYTHAHSDHVNGIDDLRVITARNKKRTPVYADSATLQELRQRFHYTFGGGGGLYPPIIEPMEITPAQLGLSLKIGDIALIPFAQDHGTCMTLGYRFGDFAYSTDMLSLDERAIESLQGISTWLVDGAGYRDSKNGVHASLETVFALNKRIGAKEVFLTSMPLGMDYQTLCRELPKGYLPAHDGLILFAGG